MTKPPDLEALARRYVELWQDQIAAAASDPELTEALVRMMQLMGGGLAASTALWQNLWAGATSRQAAPQGGGGFGPGSMYGHDGSRQHYPTSWPTSWPTGWASPAAPGPAPAAGASDVGGVDLAQLDARLAVLEKRLAAVETGARTPRRSPRRRARRDAVS